MNIKMKLKYLLTISLAIFLSACNNPNNSIPIQSDSGGYDNDYNSEYQNAPVTNTPLTNTESLAIGATGVATGYALGKYANTPRYSKSNKSYGKTNTTYGKPVVVVNKHYYQSKPKVRVSRYKRK